MANEHAQLAEWKDALLPHVVDHLARIKPQDIYAEYPVSPVTYAEGFRKITWREFANAINGVAQWLSTTLGPSSDHEVLTYIGPNDIRYIVLILGAVKAGYVMFLTSPRNSIAAHKELFERLKCTKLLSPDPKPPTVNPILEEAPEVQHIAVPTLEHLLDQDNPHYEYEKTFDQARSEPLMVIHTSGSTGFPKPLIWTHETGARNMNMHAIAPPAGFQSIDKSIEGKRVAIPFGTVLITPLSGVIPTAQGVVDALHQTTADAAFLVPSIVLELSQDTSLLDYCSCHLERCLYAGGDLPQAVWDKVAAKLRLVCQYGASEIGLTPEILPEAAGPLDWKYIHLHPSLGIDHREVTPGNYELYVKHDSAKEKFQPTFTIFPGTTEYGSRDLFKPHPTIPNMWAWCARADDIIVFLNGEKTNPISMEQHIVAQNPDTILSAIVVGAQRFQAALLLEPSPNSVPRSIDEEAALIEKVWPTVQEANNVAPAHARIEKSMVLVMSADKSVIRSGKGTIQRAATLELYSTEIDSIYRNADQAVETSNDDKITEPQDIDTVSHIVRTAMEEALDQPGISNDDNFFAIGTDSLRALNVAQKLRNIFKISEITVSTIYSNPSVTQLSEVIFNLQINHQAAQTLAKRARKETLESLLDVYKAKVRKVAIPLPSQRVQDRERQGVILTGTTGTLGTYLLDSLLQHLTVKHVYCLNRRNNARELYIQHSKRDGGQLDQKASFYQADLNQHLLGLDLSKFNLIKANATVIIHNAWPVNFNLSLDTFRPQLDGLIELLKLVTQALYKMHFFYVSSISSVLGIRDSSGVIPETINTNTDAPFSNGYAESKFISEILCKEASRYLSFPVSVARVGQIAGPVLRSVTLWNPIEWFPSLMVSSIKMGLLPDSLGASMNRIDWILVDLLSTIIVELSLPNLSNNDTFQLFHLVNPVATTWPLLLPAVQTMLGDMTKRPVKLVTASSWLSSLQRDVESVAEEKIEDGELAALLKRHPAIKLFSFFATIMTDTDDSANRLDVTNTLENSSGIRKLACVGEPWLRKWIEEWLPLTKT